MSISKSDRINRICDLLRKGLPVEIIDVKIEKIEANVLCPTLPFSQAVLLRNDKARVASEKLVNGDRGVRVFPSLGLDKPTIMVAGAGTSSERFFTLRRVWADQTEGVVPLSNMSEIDPPREKKEVAGYQVISFKVSLEGDQDTQDIASNPEAEFDLCPPAVR